MRILGLDGSELAKRGWRSGIPTEPKPRRASATPSAPSAASPRAPAPCAYPAIVAEVQALIGTTSTISPQQRGKRLEQLVHVVLDTELLTPRGAFRNPGEEIDRSFAIEGFHFLLECKWEDDPIGFPAVRDFMGKVQRKAEGTFGVFLSMSGFVRNINTSANQGQRLNSVGLIGPQFMDVIEGRLTFRQIVARARRAASDHGEFLASLRA